jgi:hypothetical protein
MSRDDAIVPLGRIEQSILLVRGQKVILDGDLAGLYGVTTGALNQAVKRNRERFPEDFMFRLTRDEATGLKSVLGSPSNPSSTSSRSQIVILKRGANVKYLPHAFTEHGAIMAASVLKSPQAVKVSVYVVRAFVKLREMLSTHKELARRLDDLERTLQKHDHQIVSLFQAIRQLMSPPDPPRRQIGFATELQEHEKARR